MSTFLRQLVRSEGKSCEGKIKFPREDSAIRSAEDMMHKKGNGEIFEHYKCSFCDGWHIGHRTNFDWIPSSHFAHRLMLNKYKCQCGFEWFTSTVFSTRILTHFPGVKSEMELCVKCPKCKNKEEFFSHGWMGRRWVNLEEIDPNSTESLVSLWERSENVIP